MGRKFEKANLSYFWKDLKRWGCWWPFLILSGTAADMVASEARYPDPLVYWEGFGTVWFLAKMLMLVCTIWITTHPWKLALGAILLDLFIGVIAWGYYYLTVPDKEED